MLRYKNEQRIQSEIFCKDINCFKKKYSKSALCHHNKTFPKQFCLEDVEKRGAINIAPCAWFCGPDTVFDDQDSTFLVAVRAENLRELLILPNEYFHTTNDALCCNEEFWNFVLEWTIKKKISIFNSTEDNPKFAFNFGLWESALANDTENLYCHAHMHLYLSFDEYEHNKKILLGRKI